jgi:hypothetical protein
VCSPIIALIRPSYIKSCTPWYIEFDNYSFGYDRKETDED